MIKDVKAKDYQISYQPKALSAKEVDWSMAEPAYLSCSPWKEYPYSPYAYAKLAALSDRFAVFLNAEEPDIRAEVTELNGPVHTDSCLEFFVKFDPEHDKQYMNFEINPIRTLFLGMGDARADRKRIVVPDYKAFFNIATDINPPHDWNVHFEIPFSFIKEYFPTFIWGKGSYLAGNFFKCGDKTERPHFTCWSPVVSEKPDFHRPESFLPLRMGK